MGWGIEERVGVGDWREVVGGGRTERLGDKTYVDFQKIGGGWREAGRGRGAAERICSDLQKQRRGWGGVLERGGG